MEVKKQVLAELNKVYAVGSIQLRERNCFLAATQERGECLLFFAASLGIFSNLEWSWRMHELNIGTRS